MTTVTAGATKAKTAQHPASSPGPRSEIPKSDQPYREMAQEGVARAEGISESATAAAAQATDLLKNTYATAAKGASDYNLKVLEIARTNAGSAFDYVHELLGVKTPAEFIELSTAHARKQFTAMSAQTKELTELAQRVTTEIAEPLKTGVAKAFNSKPV